MKKLMLMLLFIAVATNAFAQQVVEDSKTITSLTFEKSTIISMNVHLRLEEGWSDYLIYGEYSWEGTGKLRKDTVVLLKLQSKKNPSYTAWAKIAPTPPKPGKGMSKVYNESVNEANLFEDYKDGKIINNRQDNIAKTLYKDGFTIVDFILK